MTRLGGLAGNAGNRGGAARFPASEEEQASACNGGLQPAPAVARPVLPAAEDAPVIITPYGECRAPLAGLGLGRLVRGFLPHGSNRAELPLSGRREAPRLIVLAAAPGQQAARRLAWRDSIRIRSPASDPS